MKTHIAPEINYLAFSPTVRHLSPFQLFSLVYRTRLNVVEWSKVRSGVLTVITKKGSDDFRLFDEELPDLSIFDRNLFSRKENYDEEALRKRIRTLWNECVKQEGFNIQPYIQESRRLEQQYVTELTSFEILQYKTSPHHPRLSASQLVCSTSRGRTVKSAVQKAALPTPRGDAAAPRGSCAGR